ncbi:phosphopantetheine-binding protein, partial [Methylogaea oryzae]
MEFLPDYMVPGAFVVLDEMPLTPNGKVDRRQLPEPESLRPESAQPLVAPRDETERRLVHVLEELLGVEPIGIHDDFFTLGGHSLLAGRLLARLRKDFATDITFSELFQEPTAAALARLVQQQAGGR